MQLCAHQPMLGSPLFFVPCAHFVTASRMASSRYSLALARRVSHATKTSQRLSVAATPVRLASTAGPLISNLANSQDVEDLFITYGGQSAAIGASTHGAQQPIVRPLAVVKVGGEVITKDIANLVNSLKFLRDSGLHPVVIHGGGPQLNDELAKASIEPQYIGGEYPWSDCSKFVSCSIGWALCAHALLSLGPRDFKAHSVVIVSAPLRATVCLCLQAIA